MDKALEAGRDVNENHRNKHLFTNFTKMQLPPNCLSYHLPLIRPARETTCLVVPSLSPVSGSHTIQTSYLSCVTCQF